MSLAKFIAFSHLVVQFSGDKKAQIRITPELFKGVRFTWISVNWTLNGAEMECKHGLSLRREIDTPNILDMVFLMLIRDIGLKTGNHQLMDQYAPSQEVFTQHLNSLLAAE